MPSEAGREVAMRAKKSLASLGVAIISITS